MAVLIGHVEIRKRTPDHHALIGSLFGKPKQRHEILIDLLARGGMGQNTGKDMKLGAFDQRLDPPAPELKEPPQTRPGMHGGNRPGWPPTRRFDISHKCRRDAGPDGQRP